MIDSKLNSNQEEEAEEGANRGIVRGVTGVVRCALNILLMVFAYAVLPLHGSAPVLKIMIKNGLDLTFNFIAFFQGNISERKKESFFYRTKSHKEKFKIKG